MDSINKTDMAILDKEVSNEAESELGPLKYLAETTGYPMNEVVNWFLLLIIFVFDPLAIALVVAANMAFAQLKKTEPKVVMSVPEGMEFNKPYPIPKEYYPEPEEITLDGGEIEVTVEPTEEQLKEIEPKKEEHKSTKLNRLIDNADKLEELLDKDLYGEDEQEKDKRFYRFVNTIKNVDSATIDKIKEGLNIWKGKKNI